MNMHKVNCVECKKSYQSEEPDDYYCPECFKTHQQVIKETEAKLANRPRKKVVSDLQQFDMFAKQNGTKGFARAKDLGL